MPTCNILDFSLIEEYYTENISDPNNPKNSATNLCCYETLPMSYDTFVDGITDLYNSSCLRDREFSDYVTKLFTQCLSGSSSSHTHTDDGYWTGNTDGTISNSGLTETKVGIGTQAPSEMLSVSGNTNITNNLYVSGSTSSDRLSVIGGGAYFGSAIDIGIDGDGHEVTFYSDTVGMVGHWNPSRSSLSLNDQTKVEMGTSADFAFWHDGSANRINLQEHPLTITTGFTQGTTVMVINNQQQVGIGTHSGDTRNRLHVSGTSSENPVRIQTLQNKEGRIVVVDSEGVLYQAERQSNLIGYWTGNTDSKSISNSGLTDTQVGIGTHVPTEILSVSGNTNITSNLYVSGDTFYEGALSGTGDITTVGDVYTDMIKRQSSNSSTTKIKSSANKWEFYAGNSSNEVMKIEDGVVTLPNSTNFISSGNLHVTGNTFYEGALSGTGNISTVGKIECGEQISVGIPASIVPKTALDVHHDPTNLTNDTGGGEVVTFGSNSSGMVAGKLYYFNAAGAWALTDADATSTGASQLLGIGLGTSASAGVLLRGFFDVHTYLGPGTFNQGKPVYVSTAVGKIAITQPSGSNDFVRVVGYCTDVANVIYFNPDGTYIKIA